MRQAVSAGLLFGLGLMGAAAYVHAASPRAPGALASALGRVRYELRLTDGRLQGPAVAWLLEAASQAQFFFIGEEHDTSEIPAILAALWPRLAAVGYRHVAIEAGQWLGGRLDRFARSNDREARDRFRRAALPRRPSISVPPASDEDLAFYDALGRPARIKATADSPLVWGLDHELKLTPLLERLEAISPDQASRARVRVVLRDVAAAEHAGRYDMRPFAGALLSLIEAFPSAPVEEETAQLLDALRRRVSGRAGGDQERGDVFRQLFVRQYRAAQAAGEASPRVLLRFGAYHAKRGLMSEFGTSTLANFVAEFGRLEGGQMVNVMFIACSLASTDDWRAPRTHPRACSPRERAWLAPVAAAAASPWTLFDLRPLREPVSRGDVSVGWELREVIMGFDGVIVLRDSVRAHLSDRGA